MIAFHGDPKLKKMMVEEIKWHQKQDKIVQGSYALNGKFCAVGCSIESLNRKLGKTYNHSDHSVYEEALGIPRIIAKLEDRLFERLEKEDALKFPLQFIKAVPVGADLSMVWPKFALWLLVDKKVGVIKFAKKDQTKKSIQNVADLYQRKINGEKIDVNQWLEVKNAAYAAADAAYAAADAADDAAAAAAADAADAYAAADADAADADAADADAADAAYAAADAADAAAAAAAADAAAAARKKVRKLQAKKLLELLKEAPISKS